MRVPSFYAHEFCEKFGYSLQVIHVMTGQHSDLASLSTFPNL